MTLPPAILGQKVVYVLERSIGTVLNETTHKHMENM